MQHVWRDGGPLQAAVKKIEKEWTKALGDQMFPVTNVTNKASERAQAWNKANRKQYNARQKLLMAGKRTGRGRSK